MQHERLSSSPAPPQPTPSLACLLGDDFDMGAIFDEVKRYNLRRARDEAMASITPRPAPWHERPQRRSKWIEKLEVER